MGIFDRIRSWREGKDDDMLQRAREETYAPAADEDVAEDRFDLGAAPPAEEQFGESGLGTTTDDHTRRQQ